jgi:hypothetical protein
MEAQDSTRHLENEIHFQRGMGNAAAEAAIDFVGYYGAA